MGGVDTNDRSPVKYCSIDRKMTTPTEKQGHIGDIHQKTLPELRELLDRQEKLLKKQKFLQSLPDKGTKVKNFAETLRKLIAQHENNDTTHSDASRLSESFPQQTSLSPQTERGGSYYHSMKSKHVKQTGVISSETPVRDVELRGDNPINTEIGDQLSACLERVTLSGHQVEIRGDNKFINSYERVIKKANEKPTKTRVFKPNSSLKISKVQDLPDAYKFRSADGRQNTDLHTTMEEGSITDTDNSTTAHGENQNRSASVPKVQEESAVCIPDYKYDKSVLISVEESVQLVDEQRKKHDDLQTQQAAERLANRLHIRLDDYNPEGTNMNYRVTAPDTDSDDEPELEGYED